MGVRLFSVFASLGCFFISLCCAVNAVRLAQSPRYNQMQWIVGIIICFTVITVFLLLFNYGIPYFLDPTQQTYLHHIGAVMQIQE
jgi:hypothetical protein